ncbi:D-2-hydroxyacid dehydrogenase [Thalassotalea agarivorans]|uniref:Glycerate dehydrogenase n=1 Tax=Thalassotalea agarivorans TaxID=349064 RepID=A0A1H9YDA9_THASX|nr:D-2-hydroxyacid dehydrogenase [Thalassotalea agarivorans]SES66926.1 glycerate dehydrogenase [Thalassotalea agarivorans]
MNIVFLDKKTFSNSIDLNALETEHSLTSYETTTPEQVVSRCIHADVVITNKVVIDSDTLSLLPDLKLICIAATGTNNVDLEAAKALNVRVCNVSGYSTPSVAQYVFSQLLAHFQQIVDHNANTQAGNWSKSETFCILGQPIDELKDKTIAIVGYGTLGRKVADIATAFDMQVIIAERPGETPREGRVVFEEAMSQADIVTLHCPLTPQTQDLINQDTLALMKPNAILVNTARGAVVNSQALYTALKQKQIALAIVDVLEQEPPPHDHILLQGDLTNLVVTAHIAWASQQAQQRLINLIARNISAFQQGQPTNVVA